MQLHRFGVRLESLSLPIREALDAAGRMGVEAVTFDAVGDLAPDQLSQTGRRQLRHMLQSRSLKVAGIGVGASRGFDVEERLEGRIAKTIAVLKLAYELGGSYAFNHIGQIPDEKAEKTKTIFFEVLKRIGNEANRVGATFAVHISFDFPGELANLLRILDNPGIKVLYDPANVMVRGGDPCKGLDPLAGRVAGVFCKDIVRTGTSVTGFSETPIGQGEIDWPRFLAGCEQNDFAGYFVLARETGDSRLRDLQAGVDFLRAF